MKALRARDAEAARAAMRRHMDIAFKRYSASLVGQGSLAAKKVAPSRGAAIVKNVKAGSAGTTKRMTAVSSALGRAKRR
jgi:hypothetical protein